jgi:hypothetical protein
MVTPPVVVVVSVPAVTATAGAVMPTLVESPIAVPAVAPVVSVPVPVMDNAPPVNETTGAALEKTSGVALVNVSGSVMPPAGKVPVTMPHTVKFPNISALLHVATDKFAMPACRLW